jgi:uncharacterized membrane protein YgdD (TMEM256/DUF423 family)
MEKVWIALGSLAGLTAVGMAALTAHGLEGLEPARLQMMRNAVEMHGWHALALIACGIWVPHGGRLVDWAAGAFALGVVLFCGAVYSLGLGDIRLAMLPPVGGMLLMLGWILLGISAVLAPRTHQAVVREHQH